VPSTNTGTTRLVAGPTSAVTIVGRALDPVTCLYVKGGCARVNIKPGLFCVYTFVWSLGPLLTSSCTICVPVCLYACRTLQAG
jgi:hypothetical protein